MRWNEYITWNLVDMLLGVILIVVVGFLVVRYVNRPSLQTERDGATEAEHCINQYSNSQVGRLPSKCLKYFQKEGL